MKYHALLVIFEKAAKFGIVVCCKSEVALNEEKTLGALQILSILTCIHLRNTFTFWYVHGIMNTSGLLQS